jgi:hypothetical protein
MDGSQFDLLTRTIAGSSSRRVTLGGLAGGLLVALNLAQHQSNGLGKKKGKGKGKGKDKDKNKKCPNGRKRCGGKCCKEKETCDKKGKCVHHCQDGEKNFGETGIDCGGTCVRGDSGFRPCAIGQGCEVDDDCFTDICVNKGSGKECVLCRIDSDCDRTSTRGPRCLDNSCFPCAADFDCPPTGPFCIESPGSCPSGQPCACGACRVDTDCPKGQLCDGRGNCESFDCESNRDCPTGRACEDGFCTGTCVGPGGDVTDEGECCSEVDCAIGDFDICCDFDQICLGGGGNGPCG